ncbi:MAG: L28 family ribosomal protein [bacterium]
MKKQQTHDTIWLRIFDFTLMARCFITGKGNLYGRSHTHHRGVAGGRWKKRAPKTNRIFKPNLQPVTILVDGMRKQVRISASALKRVKKDVAEGRTPKVMIAKYQPVSA